MEKTALSQSNVRGNILNPESYYHNSSAAVAKTHALSLARQDLLQLCRGGGPILSSSASGQFLAPSSHWCLGGQLLPEPHVQKLSAMDLTLITAFLQSCRCPEGATGNLVPSMAQDRRDWTESFKRCSHTRADQQSHSAPTLHVPAMWMLPRGHLLSVCSQLKDPKPQGTYPLPCFNICCLHS